MNIKFNWGTGILLTIILFMAAMTGIIIFSMNQQVNLVSQDYYPKGVNYEDQINKSRNLALLKTKVSFKKEDDSFQIIFPVDFKNKEVKGNIHFYYMTDFKKDVNRKIELDTNLKQRFLSEQFLKGRYIIKLDWSAESMAYYQELDVNL